MQWPVFQVADGAFMIRTLLSRLNTFFGRIAEMRWGDTKNALERGGHVCMTRKTYTQSDLCQTAVALPYQL